MCIAFERNSLVRTHVVVFCFWGAPFWGGLKAHLPKSESTSLDKCLVSTCLYAIAFFEGSQRNNEMKTSRGPSHSRGASLFDAGARVPISAADGPLARGAA